MKRPIFFLFILFCLGMPLARAQSLPQSMQDSPYTGLEERDEAYGYVTGYRVWRHEQGDTLIFPAWTWEHEHGFAVVGHELYQVNCFYSTSLMKYLQIRRYDLQWDSDEIFLWPGPEETVSVRVDLMEDPHQVNLAFRGDMLTLLWRGDVLWEHAMTPPENLESLAREIRGAMFLAVIGE